MDQITVGAPAGWPAVFIGKTIRYRWGHDVPWRYGQVLPYRDLEDSCGNDCIRVASFGDFGLAEDACLRFATHGRWTPNAQVEIVDVPW